MSHHLLPEFDCLFIFDCSWTLLYDNRKMWTEKKIKFFPEPQYKALQRKTATKNSLKKNYYLQGTLGRVKKGCSNSRILVCEDIQKTEKGLEGKAKELFQSCGSEGSYEAWFWMPSGITHWKAKWTCLWCIICCDNFDHIFHCVSHESIDSRKTHSLHVPSW